MGTLTNAALENRFHKELKVTFTAEQYEHWFKGLQIVSVTGQTGCRLTLSVALDHTRWFLERYYSAPLKQVASAVFGQVDAIRITVREPKPINLPATVASQKNASSPAYQNDPNIVRIRARVCEHFGVTEEAIVSADRQQRLAVPRQVAMYLAYTLTGKPQEEIAAHFDRDYSTVCHARRRIKAAIITDTGLRLSLNYLTEELR